MYLHFTSFIIENVETLFTFHFIFHLFIPVLFDSLSSGIHEWWHKKKWNFPCCDLSTRIAYGVRWWPRVARLVNKVGAIIVEEVGSKNLARISHHLPHLVSLSFSLSPLRWNLLPSGWGGMASSRSQVAIFDHYGRLSGPREPIFKPKMLPITNKHLCTFASSFFQYYSFFTILPFFFFFMILNTFSNPIKFY